MAVGVEASAAWEEDHIGKLVAAVVEVVATDEKE